MIKKVDHIGIAVRSIEEALKVYRDVLGLKVAHVGEVPEEAVKIAFLPVGESEIELVQPTTDDSSVARFLAKRGAGLHHICFETDDIEAALTDLVARGLQLIDQTPRVNPQGQKFAFIHPKSTHGVLIELYERDRRLPGS